MSAALRVVVVDDNRLFQSLMLRWILGLGHDAVAVQDGLAALEAVREGRADVVVTDFLMPGMDGLELCRLLRRAQERRALYLLLVTAEAGPDLMRQAWEAGVDDFLEKPVHRDALEARLRMALRLRDLEGQVEARTRLQDERTRLALALQEQERLVGVIAHELRTPLGGMRMVADVLRLHEASLPEAGRRALGMLERQVMGMIGTLENLLEASVRRERGETPWQRFDACEALRDALAAVGYLVPETVELQERLPVQLPVTGDRDGLRRLAVNLLANACRHTRVGTIRVGLSIPAPGQVQLRVEDTGEGISEKVLAVLGEPLLLNSGNLDGERGARGAGLGLAVCKEIVARHGGSLLIESAPGVGTRVRALLRTEEAEGSPVPGWDCLYAMALACRLGGPCQRCVEECLFREGGR